MARHYYFEVVQSPAAKTVVSSVTIPEHAFHQYVHYLDLREYFFTDQGYTLRVNNQQWFIVNAVHLTLLRKAHDLMTSSSGPPILATQLKRFIAFNETLSSMVSHVLTFPGTLLRVKLH